MPKNKTVNVVGLVRLVPRGGRWYAHYTTPAGRERESLKVTNLRVATEKAKEIDELLQAGQHELLRRRRTQCRHETFQTFVDDIFMQEYPGWSDTTRRSCKPLVKKLTTEFGERPLMSITGDDFEMYLARAAGDGEWKDATYNRILAIGKAIFKYAQERGRLAHNPLATVRQKRLQEKLPHPYTDEDLGKLLQYLEDNPSKRDIALVAVDTGMRRGELMALRWPDVELIQRQFQLPKTKNRKVRVIPMTERVFEIVHRLYNENRTSRTPSIEVWGVGADIRQLLSRAGKKLGVEGATLHRLRDTFGTRMAEVTDLEVLQELMGHKSIEMTRRYVKVQPRRLAEAIAVLNG